jgi:hypothetical protein
MVPASSPDISRNNAPWFRNQSALFGVFSKFCNLVDALNMELINCSRYFEWARNIVNTWKHT